MERRVFCFLLMLLSAYFCLLLSCGEGDVVDITDKEFQSMKDNILAEAGMCENNPSSEKCMGYLRSSNNGGDGSQSSSSGSPDDGTFSSSSGSPDDGTFSSSSGAQSSSSGGSGSSSSLSSSSSSGGIASNVPPEYAFSCKWESAGYPNIMAGDKITPVYEGDKAKMDAAECSVEFRKPAEIGFDKECSKGQTISGNEEAGASGSNTPTLCALLTCGAEGYTSGCANPGVVAATPYTQPTIACSWEVQPYGETEYAAKNTATAGDYARIKYEVSDPLEGCGEVTFSGGTGNGRVFDGAGSGDYSPVGAPSGNVLANSVKANLDCSKERYTSISPSLNCLTEALTVTPVSKPTKTTGSVKLNIDYSSSSSGNFVGYYFIGSTPSYAGSNVAFSIDADEADKCDESVGYRIEGDTDDAGNLRVKAYAEVKCRNIVYPLDSARATVVPNPSLSGNCVWSKNPTSSAKGAIPSGVTLADSYGRCKVGSAPVNNGALSAAAYSGTGQATWPATGIVPAGTYSDVETNVTCDAPLGGTALSQKNCPELKVNAGSEYSITGSSDNDKNKTNGAKLSNNECLDLDFTWDNSGWPNQRIDVRCDADPQFQWANTDGYSPQRKGCIKVTYGTSSETKCGANAVDAAVTVIPLASYNVPYEILGVCAEIYYAARSDGTDTKIADEATVKANCRASVNGN